MPSPNESDENQLRQETHMTLVRQLWVASPTFLEARFSGDVLGKVFRGSALDMYPRSDPLKSGKRDSGCGKHHFQVSF